MWSARVILDELETYAPAISRALAPLRGSRRLTRSVLARAYRRAPGEPIDTAVLTPVSVELTFETSWLTPLLKIA